MALCFTGGLILKALKPNLVKPCLVVPAPVTLQVRFAARKGYREKAEKKKKSRKLEKAANEIGKRKRISVRVFRTVEEKKPEPPSDDIFILNDFKPKKYSLVEAIKFHKEYHHPTVFNNPDAYVNVRIELDLTGKKATQFVKPFAGVAGTPHPFTQKRKKEILALCYPKDFEVAIKSGASIAGGVDVVKKIQAGLIQPSFYEYVVCHVDFLQELTPVRGLFKDKMPRLKNETLTPNLESAIKRFLHGMEYQCQIGGSDQSFGLVERSVGTIDMEPEHIENNFKSLLSDIMKQKPQREGAFVTYIWCRSPPSDEMFAIDVDLYVEKDEDEDYDEDDEEDNRKKKKKLRK